MSSQEGRPRQDSTPRAAAALFPSLTPQTPTTDYRLAPNPPCIALAKLPLCNAELNAALPESDLKAALFDKAASAGPFCARADSAALLLARDAKAAELPEMAARAAPLVFSADAIPALSLPCDCSAARPAAELNDDAATAALAKAGPFFAKLANADEFFAIRLAATCRFAKEALLPANCAN